MCMHACMHAWRYTHMLEDLPNISRVDLPHNQWDFLYMCFSGQVGYNNNKKIDSLSRQS